jgi:uncharacterized protein (TIGR03032 family)
MSEAQASSLSVQTSEHINHWLTEQQLSLALTTYQTNRIFFIGCKADSDRLALHERLFDKPMGLYWHAATDRLIMTSRYQIWQFSNHLQPEETYQGADRLYVPQQSWITGDINAHDIVIDRHQRTLFVNTDFSCLATLHPDASFEPIWQPPFIRTLKAEDRCHLNGLALQDGEATYMTACSATDEPAGWRNHRHQGGIVLHIPSNEIIATGLSMPHSPRYYQNKLWLLNSGSGELGYLDGERFIPICFCPGFVRGLAFHQHYAFVGLSKLRSTSFGGLPLEHRLQQHKMPAQCGLMVIDLNSGQIIHQLLFKQHIEELFDIVVLPNIRQPRALGLQDDDIERLVNFPSSPNLITTKPTVKRLGIGQSAPVAGLPKNESINNIQYQVVYHLTPDNLRPYDSMTYPSLQQRWSTQPLRGELIGLSASIHGDMIGFAIAEQFQLPDRTDTQTELISWFVLPAYRGQGIGQTLLKQLKPHLTPANASHSGALL